MSEFVYIAVVIAAFQYKFTLYHTSAALLHWLCLRNSGLAKLHKVGSCTGV